MKKFFGKPYRWAVVFSFLLLCSVAFVLLNTFVIPRAVTPLATTPYTAMDTTAGSDTTAPAATDPADIIPVITAVSYKDANIEINIETLRENDSTIHLADIKVSNAAYLKTAFAQGTYGRNIRDLTSSIAAGKNAILAVNGDYYGFRDYGFVLRNGALFRDAARETGSDEALVIDKQGNFSIVSETGTNAKALADAGAWQILSFGPALINGGKQSDTITNKAYYGIVGDNPRTAIGQVSALHYIFVVVDGRTSESKGLRLGELAQVFLDRGCTVAYNLDGGGSSTMWFNGKLVNKPANGKDFYERRVSDIVYFGY